MNSTFTYTRGLFRTRRRIKQSDLLIISDFSQSISSALNSINHHRFLLENYLINNPKYQYSLTYKKIDENAPEVMKIANFAAELVNVGPMAAIPGALAELAVKDMIRNGSLVNLVENGGEIEAVSNRSLNVGIFAGSSILSTKLGFQLMKEDFPIGIATSSATVSHAFSFGEADAAIIISDRASIADAVATAVCNAVKGNDFEASIQAGLEIAETIQYVKSALIIRGKFVGKIGKLPKLIKFNGDINEFFKASLYEILPYNSSIL